MIERDHSSLNHLNETFSGPILYRYVARQSVSLKYLSLKGFLALRAHERKISANML